MKTFGLFLIILLAYGVYCLAQDIHYLTYEFQLIKEMNDHKDSVTSISFSPDGRLMASGSIDSNVKLWDAGSGKSIRAIMRHPAPITCLAFGNDSNILAAGAESGIITFWDVNYKEKIRTLKNHKGSVASIRFSPDGSLLASGSWDKTIRLWDMSSGDEVKIFTGHTESVNSIAFSPDGKVLASGSLDGTVKFWDMESGGNKLTLNVANPVNSIAFSPDGKTLASGASNGAIGLWKADTGEKISSLAGHKEAIGIDDCLLFTENGRFIVSASLDKRVLVWDVVSGTLLSELQAHKDAINSIAFDREGRKMASGGSDNLIKLWNTKITESFEITLDVKYEEWNRGVMELKAEVFGEADTVSFQYSLDGSTWDNLAQMKEPPYSLDWDTRKIIPEVAKSVHLRVVAEKATGLRATKVLDGTFSVDNQAPKTKHDYDGLWHREDFQINISADDGEGSGLLATRYKVNYGTEMDIKWNGQPRITDEGINTLEFWSLDKLGNEENHNLLSEVKLDKTAPVFMDWTEEPKDMPEGFSGSIKVSVRPMDEGASGLSGKIPQIDYHIGDDTEYDGYENMSDKGGGVWQHEISAPAGGWDSHGGKILYFKAKCDDVAGNQGRSEERQNVIGSAKTPPAVKITSKIGKWEKGELLIKADASDTDGEVKNVQFQYSFDGASWEKIGSSDSTPYSVKWDTTLSIPEVARTVWLRAVATDNEDLSADYITPVFGIDNQPPSTSHDYDMMWHKSEFSINLTGDDGQGSGISKTKYRIKGGSERDVAVDGQPTINEQGITTLEYWSVDAAGNEEVRKILSDIRLDRLRPSFEGKTVKREGNMLKVEIKIIDKDSGIKETPQFDYHIGSDTDFGGYKDMKKITDDVWGYDIDISERASDVSGQTLLCKVNVRDGVGNLGIETWQYGIGGQTDTTIRPVETTTTITTREDMDISSTAPAVEATGRESSIVWVTQPPEAVKLGEEVSIQGRLEPRLRKPVSINIKVTAPDDKTYNSRMDTDLNGAFQFGLTLSADGEWKISAEWAGNEEYKPAKSDVLKFLAGSGTAGSSEPETKAAKAGEFIKKNMIIIGLLIAYVFIIRLYRD